MKVSHCTLADVADAAGTVVVIDVLRAFTTAAVALQQNPSSYELVSKVTTACARRAESPQTLLVGEVDGRKVDAFDLSNSPVEMAAADVSGRPIVHRSSAGTQGVVRATGAARILVASFVVAQATAQAVQREPHVTFCLTGADDARDGDEDRACADYITALLTGGGADPMPYLDRVSTSTAGRTFGDPDQPWMRPDDVEFARQLDRYPFAMEVRRAGDRLLLSTQTPV